MSARHDEKRPAEAPPARQAQLTLDWLAELTEEQRESAIADAFSRTAATQDGQVVFATILEGLYYFRETTDLEQQALNNYAKRFIEYFGDTAKYRVLEALLKGEPHGNYQGD